MDALIGSLTKKLFAILVKCFSLVGAVFSTGEMLQKIAPNSPLAFSLSFTGAVIVFGVSLAFFVGLELYRLFFQRIPIPNTAKYVSVRFGNLLRRKNGTLLVGINNTLTYDEAQIGKDSIHSQLIRKYGIKWMRNVFEAEKKKTGLKVYPAGYAFSAEAPDRRAYLFVVMSELKNPQVPTTELEQVRKVVQGLFASDDFRCRNNRLYSPILGTGSAGLQNSQKDVAEQIAFEFVCADAAHSAAVHELVLVFRWRNLSKVDLAALRRSIQQIAERCRVCGRKSGGGKNCEEFL